MEKPKKTPRIDVQVMERQLTDVLKATQQHIDASVGTMSASDLKSMRRSVAKLEKTLALVRAIPEKRRKARAKRDAMRTEIAQLKAETAQIKAQTASIDSKSKKPTA